MDKITLERIADDADKAYPFNGDIGDISANEPNEHRRNIGRYRVGYIAGATAWAETAQLINAEATIIQEKAQKIADALAQFITRHEGGLLPDRFTYEKGIEAIQQWKDGKGKEVEPENREVNPLVLLHNPTK